MDDIDDTENENNVKFETEMFSNRWEERKVDRLSPFSLEPQVLTDLIASGYKPEYPSRVALHPLPTVPPHALVNSLTPPQSMESE